MGVVMASAFSVRGCGDTVRRWLRQKMNDPFGSQLTSAPRTIKQAAYRSSPSGSKSPRLPHPRIRVVISGAQVVLFQTTALADVGCCKQMSGLEQVPRKLPKSSIYWE
jgi:hypothetical protein